MGVESQIYTQLAATIAVTDVVSTRIYRYQAPRAAALPYLTFQRIDTQIENHATGATVTTHCRVMVDSWGEDMDTVRKLADAVGTAISGWSNPGGSPSISMCHQISDVDLSEIPDEGNDQMLFRISQDYELWYA